MISTWLTAGLLLLSVVVTRGQSWQDLDVKETPVVIHTVNDTLTFPVHLVEDSEDQRLFFATQLQTNVCNDQICLPIEVNLFWDLLGSFHHFSREEGFDFTKFDHQYFDEQDYERLQQILLDSLSALRDYAVEDLLDKEPKKFSFQVDAVTRPTSPLFSNVTVPGALFTVYTLWHIVNGPVKQELFAYTAREYANSAWQSYFATSEVPHYQEYFLKHLDSEQVHQYDREIKDLLFAADDFVPHYAIDVLEENVLKDPLQYNEILGDLENLKSHVVTEIINKIVEPNEESRTILASFQKSAKSSAKQKELIEKILNYEKQ
ncbi:MAG: hypothetical protein ACTHZ7_15650 [Sphingobacterium sp.]